MNDKPANNAADFADMLVTTTNRVLEQNETIESLRQQLAAVTKTLDETVPWRELQAENKELRKQLAECERERDDHLRSWNRVVEERIAVTKERDAYVSVTADMRKQLDECERERKGWQEASHINERIRTDIRQQLATVTAERDELRQICRDAYEVWAGSEGIPEPVYASEAYLYQLLINMRDEVKRGLAKLGADKGEVR